MQRPLSAALLATAMLAAGCNGNTASTNGMPALSKGAALAKPAPRGKRVTAFVSLTQPSAERPSRLRKTPRRQGPRETPIAEEALQVGHAYPNRESWAYKDLDPSCGSLDWTYTNSIPGVTVTLNPTSTDLGGSTEVSFSMIPVGTPTGVYTQTVTGTCTGDDPSGTLPTPTSYTIAVVTLDVGRIAQIPAAPTIESDKTFEPVVGQFMELQAVPQPKVTLRKTTWKDIPGKIIGSYTESPALASPKPFDPTTLSKPTIDFFWIQDSGGTALPLHIYAVFPVDAVHCDPSKCTGKEDEWGATDADSKANVVAPTGVRLSSQTGKVLVGPNPSEDCDETLHFGFAKESTCPGAPGSSKGIAWTFSATAPDGGGGDLDATQLIDRNDSRTHLSGASGNPTPPIGTNGKSLLDQCMRYGNDDNAHQAVAANASATWTSSDSPELPLSPDWDSLTDADTFSIYLVYKPSDESGLSAASYRSNIWIPLGVLHWNWSGTAKNKGKVNDPHWVLATSSSSHNPSGAAGIQPLPTWTGLFNAAAVTCPPGG